METEMAKNITAQRIWNVLRQGNPWTAQALAVEARASAGYTGTYLIALKKHGYLEKTGEVSVQGRQTAARWRLARNTGPAAPHLRAHAARIVNLWDPNLDPQMAPEELRAIRATSGLSLARFAVEALGWAPSSGRGVLYMERGVKPITPEIKKKVLDFKEFLPAAEFLISPRRRS